MTQLVWLLGIVVLSQIYGCASVLTSTGNADDQIDRWLEQREYGKALALVAHLRESPSPAIGNLQETQEKVDVQIASYEQHVIAKAESASRQSWGAAWFVSRRRVCRMHTATQENSNHSAPREHVEMLELDRNRINGCKGVEVNKLADAKNPHVVRTVFVEQKGGSAKSLLLI
jgi:hypothetical protein